jgi:hypothetical protein|tara:strand:+ start:328 stop:633 length:306 start_codon:yes stop_codon:yes gene_type:complete
MGFKDNLKKRKDGSFILKSKTKTHKDGECTECGFNENDSGLGGLFQYKAKDVELVRYRVEEHLTFYSDTKSCKIDWCTKCKQLKQYVYELKDSKSKRGWFK